MNTLKYLAIVGALLIGSSTLAAEEVENLALFKSGGMTQGLWRMEMLSSSDPAMTKGAAAMGKMSLCMDVAKKMTERDGASHHSCKPKVLRNEATSAEVEVQCQDGARSHVTLNRESDKSYLMDTIMIAKDGKPRSFKARYTYEGECKNSTSAVQMDKNSDACKQMGNVDMSQMAGMCDRLPAAAKAQCEQQMKSMAGACK